jgi:hypothetical protein
MIGVLDPSIIFVKVRHLVTHKMVGGLDDGVCQLPFSLDQKKTIWSNNYH